MFVLALEGPAHAGKSTLAKNIKALLTTHKTIILPDYAEVAGANALPQSPLETVSEELASFDSLIALDSHRTATGLASDPAAELMVMDRSIHTLLAHRLALRSLFGIELFERCCEIALTTGTVQWPSLIAYIDVPQSVLTSRYSQRSGELSILLDPSYNEQFRAYFIPTPRCRSVPLVLLDGKSSEADMADMALASLSRAVPELQV